MAEWYRMLPDGDVEPCTQGEWAAAFNETDRILRKDTVGGSTVSTVFLGLNHAFGDGPPMIFETLVFGGLLADEMQRYSTRADALAGHAAMLERVRAAEMVE